MNHKINFSSFNKTLNSSCQIIISSLLIHWRYHNFVPNSIYLRVSQPQKATLVLIILYCGSICDILHIVYNILGNIQLTWDSCNAPFHNYFLGFHIQMKPRRELKRKTVRLSYMNSEKGVLIPLVQPINHYDNCSPADALASWVTRSSIGMIFAT